MDPHPTPHPFALPPPSLSLPPSPPLSLSFSVILSLHSYLPSPHPFLSRHCLYLCISLVLFLCRSLSFCPCLYFYVCRPLYVCSPPLPPSPPPAPSDWIFLLACPSSPLSPINSSLLPIPLSVSACSSQLYLLLLAFLLTFFKHWDLSAYIDYNVKKKSVNLTKLLRLTFLSHHQNETDLNSEAGPLSSYRVAG